MVESGMRVTSFGKKIRFILVLLVVSPLALLGGCFPLPEHIRDIQELTQDNSAYVTDGDRYLISAAEQEKLDQRYDDIFFSVWHVQQSAYGKDDTARYFSYYKSNLGYGKNGRRYKKIWIRRITANAFLQNYPNRTFNAITVTNADIRYLPTYDPHYMSKNLSVRGFPFDNLQISLVAANTPLRVSHITRDGRWYLAETSFAFGWIPSRAVARVDESFMASWEKKPYAVIVKDKFPLRDAKGKLLFTARLGSMFPLREEKEDMLRIAAAGSGKMVLLASRKF
ncbi:MAG: NlpC/P60 family N-terminal domain-containing protein [Smithellaceae bacterium]|nr:NlpC/P60 family N-terminal domain-containing protein [Smithellaceae bacterium]